ncbi:hypothetical protein [Aestuariivirga sp.]|uniref:hypothetical protein n=1 Tax=Aestuariivirga sp. TaxID=2650926 RepID=UPI00391D1093
MSRWPWISLIVTIALAASPWGREFLSSAFVSGEQLSRNIARPIVLAAGAAMLILALCEYLLRLWYCRRRDLR